MGINFSSAPILISQSLSISSMHGCSGFGGFTVVEGPVCSRPTTYDAVVFLFHLGLVSHCTLHQTSLWGTHVLLRHSKLDFNGVVMLTSD